MDFLFKFVPKRLRDQLQYDEEALYSATDQYTADKITQELLRFFPANSLITDGTACIGGNTFSLAQSFHHVNAVEMDATKYEFLKNNMKVLGVNNVATYHSDILNILSSLDQSLLFLDPPWGGPNYKSKDTVPLFLSRVPLEDACREFVRYTPYIALKTPVNFDITTFVSKTEDILHLSYKNTKLRKLHLYIFERK